MNIVCDKVLLSAAIDGVSKAVTMRSAIPVLEGILLKAEGFQLNLTGYDLEMGIVTTSEANVKEAGEVVLNAKLLSSMISRMPAGQISILSADNGKTILLGKKNLQICGISSAYLRTLRAKLQRLRS